MTERRWKLSELGDEGERDKRALDELLGYIVPRIVAIAVDGRDDVFSGFLVETESRYFVVTAHHCLRDLEGPEALHFLGVGRLLSDRPARSDVIASAFSTNESDSPGACDVAFLELGQGFAQHLTNQGARWTPLDSLHSRDARPGKSVLFVGFPQDRVKPHPIHPRLRVIAPTVYTSEVTTRDVSRMDEYDEMWGCFSPHMHLLLELPTVHASLDGGPSERHGTDGMSGSAVFLFPGCEADETWSAGDTRIVGVYTADFPKRKLMFVHRSEMVYDLIFQYLARAPNPPARWGDT